MNNQNKKDYGSKLHNPFFIIGGNMQKKWITIGICLITILSTIFVGSPIKEAFGIPMLAIYILTIIYLLFGKTKQIPWLKMDTVIAVFCLSTLLPLIFQTSISKNDTVVAVFQYTALFCLWLLVRNSIQTQVAKDKIKNTTIICIILLCILGVDELTTRIPNSIFQELSFTKHY